MSQELHKAHIGFKALAAKTSPAIAASVAFKKYGKKKTLKYAKKGKTMEHAHKLKAKKEKSMDKISIAKSLIREAIYDGLEIEKGKIWNATKRVGRALKSGTKKAAVGALIGGTLLSGGAKVAQMDNYYSGHNPNTKIEQVKNSVINADKKYVRPVTESVKRTSERVKPIASEVGKRALSGAKNIGTAIKSNTNLLDTSNKR